MPIPATYEFVVKSVAGSTTAATAIEAKPVTIAGFTVNASNTTGASTITLWDNASAASGAIVWQKTIATQTAANTQMYAFPSAVALNNGLTITIATTAVGTLSFWLA